MAWHVSEELLAATYKMKIKLFLLLVLREHRKVILRLSVIRAQEGKQMEELRRAKGCFPPIFYTRWGKKTSGEMESCFFGILQP